MIINIEQFVYRNFPEARPYGNPANDIEIHCPFCGDDKYHMKIGIARIQAIHCFRCSYSASYVKFVMDYKKVTYYIALSELYVKPTIVNLLAEQERKKPHAPRICSMPKDFRKLHYVKDNWGKLARRYLESRGFNSYHWKYYNLGLALCVPSRIVIPIENGYWQGRRMFDWMDPKYLNPKADARSVIFNAKALNLYKEVVVCEGAFSAMAVGENAVALVGKEPTDEKCDRIIASPAERIVIALEPGAYGSMGAFMQRLTRSGKQVIVWKYSVGDPADPAGVFIEMEYDLKTRLSLKIGE